MFFFFFLFLFVWRYIWTPCYACNKNSDIKNRSNTEHILMLFLTGSYLAKEKEGTASEERQSNANEIVFLVNDSNFLYISSCEWTGKNPGKWFSNQTTNWYLYWKNCYSMLFLKCTSLMCIGNALVDTKQCGLFKEKGLTKQNISHKVK